MTRRWRTSFLMVLIASSVSGAEVDFSRDIRPVLSDICFQCHGPDESQRQGDLRLDTQAGLFSETDGRRIIVPGQPAQSELYRRIASDDPDERMPPPESKRHLSPSQMELIRQWIEQGAQWRQHWSFVTPVRPRLPTLAKPQAPVANPIDVFIQSRLEQEGLSPSPEADRATLIRRVTLDLTGLPPTPAEVDAFLADDSPQAYGRLVDRLLQSPRYGERMAVEWLDAARYADTSGYQNDGPRQMWRWRDWVIEALNAGMPFDQFTIEQLAGDLLPNATRAQRIATGFNRNHRGNAEGGIIADEYQVEYVVDRVETTGAVWLGLTVGCTRCHDHKYDPLSQKEFYQLFAYFNNIPEYGRAIKEGNSPPFVLAPTDDQQRQLEQLELQVAAARRDVAADQAPLREGQQQWEQTGPPGLASASSSSNWKLTRGLVVDFDCASHTIGSEGQPQFRDGDTTLVPGRIGEAAAFDGVRYLDAGDTAAWGYFDKFSLSSWIFPEQEDAGTVLSRMTDADQADGYYVQVRGGHVHVNLVKRWLDDSIRVRTKTTVPVRAWTHLLVTYDGSRSAKGLTVYLNGQPVELEVEYDFLNQTFATKEPLRIGGGGGPQGRFHGLIDEVRIYNRCLPRTDAEIVAVPEAVDTIRALPEKDRSPAQRAKLARFYLEQVAAVEFRDRYDRLLALEEQHQRMLETLPTVMVMQELPQPRETRILKRGEYDKPGDLVTPNVPSVFPQLPSHVANNRLGLARWLTDSSQPLTARVAVNRCWQMFFGIGLVKTAEDFGAQGERPSHPELLDWLATEFIHTDWDVKQLHRLIVTSATYRQSSRVTQPTDPENRLLARAPRFRLSAEMVRDQALAAAGLLVDQVGGPSVKTYQPGDLWKDIATDTNYEQDHGAQLYRRGMYTYWKRTVVPPVMATFDGSSREMCQVRPRRTNTPLQALALMNEVTFVEAARVLAQRTLQASSNPDERIVQMFRAILVRSPSDEELKILRAGLQDQRARFQQSPEAAQALIKTGEFPVPSECDPVELAAHTMLASLLLNLDEAVTKN